MSKSEIVRAWFAGKQPPATSADCAECAAETGIAASTVFFVMRHAPTPDARRTYYRERKRIYMKDPGRRAAHNESVRRAKMRKRQAQIVA